MAVRVQRSKSGPEFDTEALVEALLDMHEFRLLAWALERRSAHAHRGKHSARPVNAQILAFPGQGARLFDLANDALTRAADIIEKAVIARRKCLAAMTKIEHKISRSQIENSRRLRRLVVER